MAGKAWKKYKGHDNIAQEAAQIIDNWPGVSLRGIQARLSMDASLHRIKASIGRFRLLEAAEGLRIRKVGAAHRYYLGDVPLAKCRFLEACFWHKGKARIIYYLHRFQPLQRWELEGYTGIPTKTLQSNLQDLIAGGYVKTDKCPIGHSDQKGPCYWLTTKATRMTTPGFMQNVREDDPQHFGS